MLYEKDLFALPSLSSCSCARAHSFSDRLLALTPSPFSLGLMSRPCPTPAAARFLLRLPPEGTWLCAPFDASFGFSECSKSGSLPGVVRPVSTGTTPSSSVTFGSGASAADAAAAAVAASTLLFAPPSLSSLPPSRSCYSKKTPGGEREGLVELCSERFSSATVVQEYVRMERMRKFVATAAQIW